jgi:hypothetical protein
MSEQKIGDSGAPMSETVRDGDAVGGVSHRQRSKLFVNQRLTDEEALSAPIGQRPT